MRRCSSCQRSYPDDMDFCPRDATPLGPAPPPPSFTEAHITAGLARRYRIKRRLGEGGMGTVFLAEQIAVGNRPVALKVLRRKLLEDPEFLQRFADEASSTGRISHRNVVTVHECGQADDGSPYIAMEYLEGESLRDVLRRRKTLPLESVVEVLTQAARGLNAAHRLGIIHRDLKPDNIFLSHDDEGKPVVKILDFGIAKMRESSTRTLTGIAIGTPAYMSVEQAAGMRSSDMDGRSDIYSLGIVVYEMLAGRVPFDVSADTPMAYVSKHLIEPPIPLRDARPDLVISPALEAAVMKALRKKREERYDTPLEFAVAVTQASSALIPRPATRAPGSVTRPSPPKYEPKPRRLTPVAAGSVVVALLTTGAAGWHFFSQHNQQPSPASATQKASSPASQPVATQSPQPESSPSVASPTNAPKRQRVERTVIPNTPQLRVQERSAPQKIAPALSVSQVNAHNSAQVEAATALGDLLMKRGDYDEAIAEYQKGLETTRSDATLKQKIDHARRAKAAEQKVSHP